MERLYRILLLGLFVLGFIGAVASADREGGVAKGNAFDSASEISEGRWEQGNQGNQWIQGNQDDSEINQDGLARVEAFLREDPDQKNFGSEKNQSEGIESENIQSEKIQ